MRRYSLFARTSVCLAKETGTPINKAASSPASKTAPQAASRSEFAPHKYSKDVSTTPVWRKGGESAVVTDAITTSRRVQMYQGGKAPRDYLSGPTASASGPKEDDPTTWPKEWDATAIEEFLSGKLKEGAKVSFGGLAFFLHDCDFESLKKHYLDQLAPQKYLTVHDLLVHMSQPIFRNRFHLLTTTSNWSTIVRRSTSITDDQYVALSNVRAKLCVLYIVTCESGGGKTVDAIAAVSAQASGTKHIVFYFLATDISAGFDPNLSSDDCKKIVVTNLVAAMEAVLAEKGEPHYLKVLRATTETITLGIVVDEAGGTPEVVRALCGVMEGLGDRLGLPKNVTVLVAVAGTGVGCGSVPPGSLPTTYSTHRVATGEYVWKNLTQDSTNHHAMTKAVEEHARGSLVIKNPRFARLLYSEIEQVVQVTSGLPGGSATALVESCLVNAAIKFKNLNGLSVLHDNQLLHVVGAAVAAIQTHNTPPVPCPSFSDTSDVIHKDLNMFIRAFGMVVDNASWSRVCSDCDIWGQLSVPGPKDKTTVAAAYLVSPKGARYTLSVSQSAIFLLLLGLVPARSELTGETLESTVTTLFPLLISAYRGRTVGEMLSVFGSSWSDSTLLLTQSSLDVQVARYNGTGQGVLEDFGTKSSATSDGTPLNPSQACVIVNGPKYPFADIVVAIPNAALILVQCKDYSSNLTEAVIFEELHKMGHPLGRAPRIKPPPPTSTRSEAECNKILATKISNQSDQYAHKQDQMQRLAKAFNVPKVNDHTYKITYLFVTSNQQPHFKNTPDDVCCGAIEKLPTPLAEMVPFDTNKVSGPPTINDVGRLPQELYLTGPLTATSDTPTPAIKSPGDSSTSA